MVDKDYYSFEEVLKNLKLQEDELKRLVSAGEIRAFRDQDTMRFKAEDVEKLKRSGDELELDDLELDLDLDDEPAAAAVAAEDDGEDELLLEDEEEAPRGEVEEIDLAAEAEAEENPAARGRGGRAARGAAGAAAGAGRRGGRASAPAAAGAGEEEGVTSPGILVALIAGLLFLAIANFLVFDAVAGRASNPLSQTVAGMFGK